jgi:hypothetical protein
MFINLFKMLPNQENVYTCAHACHKTSLIAVEDINYIFLYFNQETFLEPLKN